MKLAVKFAIVMFLQVMGLIGLFWCFVDNGLGWWV